MDCVYKLAITNYLLYLFLKYRFLLVCRHLQCKLEIEIHSPYRLLTNCVKVHLMSLDKRNLLNHINWRGKFILIFYYTFSSFSVGIFLRRKRSNIILKSGRIYFLSSLWYVLDISAMLVWSQYIHVWKIGIWSISQVRILKEQIKAV